MNDVSVVIPCYEHASDLARTLEALTRQTLPAKEIIVVDDLSTDDPETVVKRFSDRLPIHFLRLQHHHGAPTARNEGARLTGSRYLLFLDADIELSSDALETFVQALETHPEADFAYSDFTWGRRTFNGRPFDLEALKKRNYISTMSLIRHERFPGFDEKLTKFQDWDLWLTMALNGSKGVWIDRVLFHATDRGQGISKWLPKVAHQIPWPILGWMPKEVRRYQDAEAIIRKKHHI